MAALSQQSSSPSLEVGSPGAKLRWKYEETWLPLGFPGGSDSKESACNAGELGSIPGLGSSPGGGMATPSSILAWRIPWTEAPGGLQSMGSQDSDITAVSTSHFGCLWDAVGKLQNWWESKPLNFQACGTRSEIEGQTFPQRDEEDDP